MNKFKDTRLVVFKENYDIKTRDGGKRTIYKKGGQYAIHVNNVKVLESRGAKFEASEPDWKALKAKRKRIMDARKKASTLIYE